MTRKEFLQKVKSILQPSLESRHYLLSSPPTRKSMVWFERVPQEDIYYRIVELQPGELSQNEIIDVAVNLARRSYRDYDYPPKVVLGNEKHLDVRLSPRLWEEESTVMDYWWHLFPLEESDEILKDMLEKIIDFGIPFLEDEKSSQARWLPKT